jgi:simple sugar transport system substrate-binding protein
MKVSVKFRYMLVCGLLFCMASLLTACGGGNSTSDDSSASGETKQVANESGGSDDSGVTIDIVPAAAPGDPFWAAVKNGAEQAGEDLGVNVVWKDLPGQFDIAQYVQNIKAALATKPDGLAITFSDVAALTPIVEEAEKQGVPVVAFNEGLEEALEVGAITGVGSNEYEAGKQAGERMSEAGLTNVLCVNPVAGVIALEHRCEGFEAGFDGKSEVLVADVGDPTSTQQRISSAVQSNSDVDGLITLWAEGSDLALAALEETSKDSAVKVATFDLSPTSLKNVGDKKLLFAIDQQPFLQGYLPIQILAQHHEIGVNPIGLVNTGPLFVTEENAQEVIELSKEGLR